MAAKTRRGEWIRPDILEGGRLWLPAGAVFKEELAMRFEAWCWRNLVFPSGFRGGEPVAFEPWQRERVIYPLLGPVWEDPPGSETPGARVVRQMFYLSARGTGKTVFAAAFALWCLAEGWEPHAAIDLFAVSREQAARVFSEIARFVQSSPTLVDAYDVMADRMRIHPNGVRTHGINTRSGDSKAELGLRPTLSIVDELLSQRDRRLWSTIKTAQGKRPNSLLLSFTTPDVKVESFARKEYDRAKEVEAKRWESPEYLPVIFEPPHDADPFDRRTWIQAAPALESGFLDWSVYETEAKEAKSDPTALAEFRVFRCAQWATAGHGFFNMSMWDANDVELPPAEYLEELVCFFGLDASLNDDLTSLCMLFVDTDEDCLYAVWRHWVTSVSFKNINDFTGGSFDRWIRMDNVDVSVHQGNWIDGRVVADEVAELALRFRPVSVGVDSFRSREYHKMLGTGDEGYGLNVKLLSQTGRSMQAATERVSAEVVAGRLRHNGDGLSRWSAACCSVKYDAGGFPKVIKAGGEPKSPMKIDPMDALFFSTDRLLEYERLGDLREPPAKIWRPKHLEERDAAETVRPGKVLVTTIPDW